MNDYLTISNLNDFVFCPISIYFHNLYSGKDEMIYQTEKQIDGKMVHKAIDNNTYSNRKYVLQGFPVYSEKFKLLGKIDLFDISKKELVERKKKIKTIYDGYVFQLYAQYYCLMDMGYEVKDMKFYSYDDNKSYKIPLPENNPEMREKFFETLKAISEFNMDKFVQTNKDKCKNCIYSPACDRSLV